ncbi:MAG: c-type cytochrome [Burkholderiales bacterium]
MNTKLISAVAFVMISSIACAGEKSEAPKSKTAAVAPAASPAPAAEAPATAPAKVAAADTAKPAVPAAAPAAGGATPYKVVDGNKVDTATMNGWRTWRALACERCHGPNQEGMVGPSLIASLKVLNKDEFKKTVLVGRPEKGMPNFDGTKQVVDNIDGLYAYLKGRSDGAIQPGKVTEIQ